MANALNKVNSGGIEDGSIVNADIKSDAAIAGSKLADNAVGLAQMASGTDGQIITYDASGDPIAVGPGTDGQVLTSTGAGSPPAFEDIPAAGAALTGSTNNTIVTVTGANAIQGESGLTFDGSTLNFTAASGDARLSLFGTEGNDARITLCADEGDDHIDQWNIRAEAANHFVIDQFSGGSFVERLRIGTEADNGDVTVKTGNLVIGTAGKGIDFSSSQTPAGGMASELFDHYEEGTFTPTYKDEGGSTIDTSNRTGKYTRIGRVVHLSIFSHVGSGNTASNANIGTIEGVPFNGASEPNSSGIIIRYPGGNHQAISAYTACYLSQGGTQIKVDQSFSLGVDNMNLFLTYTV
tara:strand:- start:7130 stop:8185 length:1056 start_codon:yes stop_codon:yes gene_type:complete